MVIASKAELAFNSERELVKAKVEIIENLKNILELRNDLNHEQRSTKNALSGQEDTKNGVKETYDFVEVHAPEQFSTVCFYGSTSKDK